MWGGGRADDEAVSAANETPRDTATAGWPGAMACAARHARRVRRRWWGWQDGFAVALQPWDHPLMSKLTAAQMRHQFGDTLAEMRAILGASVCVWIWRPPYADYNQAVLTMAASYGLTTITWDDSSDDWDRPGVSKIVANVLSNAHPGAVVLMHDGPALRDQTAAALPAILAGLRERRLLPVTLPKLLADGHYPGVAVSGS